MQHVLIFFPFYSWWREAGRETATGGSFLSPELVLEAPSVLVPNSPDLATQSHRPFKIRVSPHFSSFAA